MLYYDRIDVSEEIDVNRSIEKRKYMLLTIIYS